MRYVLLVSNDETASISPQESSRRETAFRWFQNQMRSRGTLLAGERLQASKAATTVRCWDGGDVMISPGSNATPAEQLTGVYVVDCENVDEAIEVATTVPAAWYGTVEVRPVRAEVPTQQDRLADEDSSVILAAG